MSTAKKQPENAKIGAQILVDCLEELGVKYVFGYPGGYILPITDVLSKSKIKMVLNGDERCAGHAAEGYTRASGQSGVCLATSGPGATNLVTPLADAKMDSTPIIAITGQVNSWMIGRDAFQESPIQNITMQITKHNFLVTESSDIARTTGEAFHIARSGRPGPVHIDITKDALVKPVSGSDKTFRLRGYNPTRKLNLDQVDRALSEIQKARRPFIYAGQGIVLGEAVDEFRKFVETSGIPVGLTLLSLGTLPASHPLYCGMLGMHGPAYANYAIHDADLILCLGARFDDRVTGNPKEFAKQARVIHVDIDPSEINKNREADIPVTGDIREVLHAMNKQIKKGHYQEWISHIDALKRKYPLHYHDDGSSIKPQYFIERLCEQTRHHAIVSTGVGQHQMWTAQYYRFERPRSFITSGGAGTMGFGLPAAVGAQFARPHDLVIDIDGDGSFEMNIDEMRTVSDWQLPVKVCILNNKILGMVGQWQRKFFKGNYASSEFKERYPDFAAGVTALYGIPSRRITRKDEVDGAIETMIKTKGPYLLDVRIPKEEDVHPMIPAGGTLKDIILE